MPTTDDNGGEELEPTEQVEAVAPPVGETASPVPNVRALVFSGGILVILLAALVLVGVLAGDDDGSVVAATDRDTTTTTAGEETTTTSEVAATTTTTVLAAAEPSATTATTALACRNSTDAACGRFRFDPPAVANQLMQVNATVEPPNPQPGQVVTFTFQISDDAVPTQGSTDYGDGTAPTVVDRCSPRRAQGFGPWTPPPHTPGTSTLTAQHVYAQAGTFRFTSALNSSSWGTTTPPGDARGCPRDPYADTVTLEATITVS